MAASQRVSGSDVMIVLGEFNAQLAGDEICHLVATADLHQHLRYSRLSNTAPVSAATPASPTSHYTVTTFTSHTPDQARLQRDTNTVVLMAQY